MSGKRSNKDALEVSSQPIQDELVAIKDRLSAIETIQAISNAAVVKKYVEEHLKTDKAKAIMRECSEPRTKAYLIEHFRFNSPQALNNHLRPLMRDDLLREQTEEDGTRAYVWSNLFRRLPHSSITAILKA